MRLIGIFCAAFVIFFLIGAATEYRARKDISDKDFLMESAAARFHYITDEKAEFGKDKYYYQCGKRVFYNYDPDSNAIEQVEFTTTAPAVEPSVTHGTVVLLATGLGITEAAAYVRLRAGLSGKDKIAALLGGLSGYTLGRWTFSRTELDCDAPQVLRALAHISGTDIGRAIVKHRLSEYLLLVEPEPVLLTSQLAAIHRAFDVDALASGNGKACTPYPQANYWVSAGTECRDFLLVEEIKQRLTDEHYIPTRRDLNLSSYSAWHIAEWANAHPALIRLALAKPSYYGVTTRSQRASMIGKKADDLHKELSTTFTKTITIVTTAGGVCVVVMIFIIGGVAIYRLACSIFSHARVASSSAGV